MEKGYVARIRMTLPNKSNPSDGFCEKQRTTADVCFA